MIDVCFSNGTHGKILFNLGRCKNDDIDALKQQHPEIDSDWLKEIFVCQKKTVKSIVFNLDADAIDKDRFKSGRINFFRTLLHNCSDFAADTEFYQQAINLNYVVRKAQEGKNLRIWYSDEAYSLCGLYFLFSKLKGIKTEIILVPLPDGENFGEFGDEYLHQLHKTHLITNEERMFFEQEWDRLKSENTLLRIVENGKVKSVSETYFDDIILSCVSDGEFDFVELVFEALSRIQEHHFVCDTFVTMRILKLIENGNLTIVKEYKKENAVYPCYILSKVSD